MKRIGAGRNIASKIAHSQRRIRGIQLRSRGRKPLVFDDVIDVYKKDVDVTLIREDLKLSVEQRLRNLMALQWFAEEVRRADKVTFRKL